MDDLNNFSVHKENITTFVRHSISNCQRMYNMLSDELDRKEINEHALYGYHSMAFSSFMTMKAYYLQNDILSHWEFDMYIAKFEQFSREFISSRETNHSMQWTFGYYHELIKAFNNLAGLLEINEIKVPE
ncbi:hypothetical protein [Sporosarcina cyprini]|uniref:hypothetical protein n=1 Tax=Sporosarcina cyprini TaxID=2910523 RepID=UPI001EDFF593|nr:hypothetical protein [Sporosarcina cyprini]MCG3089140.1 hypothetical protein [Sporosarcina cyprini]